MTNDGLMDRWPRGLADVGRDHGAGHEFGTPSVPTSEGAAAELKYQRLLASVMSQSGMNHLESAYAQASPDWRHDMLPALLGVLDFGGDTKQLMSDLGKFIRANGGILR